MLLEDVKKTDKYSCDKCKKTFTASEVKLVEPGDRISIIPHPIMGFVYVDKNGIIIGCRQQASKEKGDKMLACPHCMYVHLFGFDFAS